ncbi:zinc-dependent alcohol dehydrogenase family protein [Mycolicibacterium stellerae]|uniref:zinc-dependent alcohol dehydrogenase family protein n=1 Tax=Mycolicibacterium stellerae TaxID=2358193 RepID=UPI000F0BBF2A|nr:zinc-dependent alcohol dehydrogenase family protein [Mycolicibacterium stellerae]
MRALQIESFGDALEVLSLVDAAEPGEPGPGEVLVSVQYSPLNVHDLHLIGGHLVPVPLPAVVGNEGLATVLSTGVGVSNVAAGDRVVLPLLSGAWRERLVLPAAGLFALPEGDPQQLSMLGSNVPTAGLALSEFVLLKPGDWVIQNAANGGVGRSLIALAHHRGLRTVNLVRRPDLADELTAAGADLVLLDEPGVAAEIGSHLGDTEILLALDSIRGQSATNLIDALSPGATIVSFGNASGQAIDGDAAKAKDITLSDFFVGAFDNITHVVPVIHEAAPLVASGELHVPIAGVYDLADFRCAIAHLQRGGKVLLNVGG